MCYQDSQESISEPPDCIYGLVTCPLQKQGNRYHGVLLADAKSERSHAIATPEHAMDEYHAPASTTDTTRIKSTLQNRGNRYQYARWPVQFPVSHKDLTDTDTDTRIAGLELIVSVHGAPGLMSDDGWEWE